MRPFSYAIPLTYANSALRKVMLTGHGLGELSFELSVLAAIAPYTACGIIMATAFGTMMLSDSIMLKEFGFALALAIMLDAFFVRIYLFPAMMSLMGKWNWYAPEAIKRKRDKKSTSQEASHSIPEESAENKVRKTAVTRVNL